MVTFKQSEYRDFPDNCFFCSKELSYDEGVILWSGYDGVIGFHRNCAARYMANIGSDLIQFKQELKKRNEIDIF